MSDTASMTVIEYLLGDIPINLMKATIITATLGLILRTSYSVLQGIRNNPKTSSKWSWKDFGWTTAIRVVLSFIVTSIVIIASVRLMGNSMTKEGLIIYSFAIGLFIDVATKKLFKFTKAALGSDTITTNKSIMNYYCWYNNNTTDTVKTIGTETLDKTCQELHDDTSNDYELLPDPSGILYLCRPVRTGETTQPDATMIDGHGTYTPLKTGIIFPTVPTKPL